MTESSAHVVVAGPAAPETVRVFRAVAASVASRLGMTIEDIDELKIAVDEAATMLLKAGSPVRLELTLDPSPSTVRAVVRSDARVDDWPGARTGGWSWRVIQQLAASATCELGERGPQIAFDLVRPAHER